MLPKSILARRALNKAYLKSKVSREEIEAFKGYLLVLLDWLKGKERHWQHLAGLLMNSEQVILFLNRRGGTFLTGGGGE